MFAASTTRSTIVFSIVATFASLGTGAAAQSADPNPPPEEHNEAPQPAPLPAPTETSQTSTQGEPAATAKEEPKFSTVVAGVPIRLTGILHAAVYATQGVQSYGLPTAVGITAAANPAVLAKASDGELSFQVQQTRLGMTLGEGTDLKGVVEVDFIHFDQSSPTTQAFPRLRLAVLTWTFAPKQQLFAGQTWDLFGNATGSLLSHSFNLIGTLFQAGNIGFMRHQVGWSGRFGDFEAAAAVGLQGANTGPTFNDIERSLTPTGSARAMWHFGDFGVVGISGLGTALQFTQGAEEDRRLALGGQLFADLTFGPINIHAEAYLAQNLANLGALNLSQGRFGTDIADAGGYVSGKMKLGDHVITAMVGGAAVLNPADVVANYVPSATPGGVGSPNLALGPGIRSNYAAHVGYGYSPFPGLTLFVEPYVYVTRVVLAQQDQDLYRSRRFAFGAQVGAMFQF